MLIVDWTIKIGDILTIATIIITLVALLISWSKDRYTKLKEQADKVRGSAAAAFAKLDRWQALQFSNYQHLQPFFVEASEMAANSHDLVAARDFLWKSINAQLAATQGKIVDEQIESAYVGLFSNFPMIRKLFLSTLDQLKGLEADIFNGLLHSTQRDVLSFEKQSQSAILGNALRTSAAKSQVDFEQKADAVMKPVRDFLLQVISMPDKEILTKGLKASL